MAVASIASYDWPEDWPDLLPYLMKLINNQTNMNGDKPFQFMICQLYLDSICVAKMSLSETLSFLNCLSCFFIFVTLTSFFCFRFTHFLNFAVHGALRCLAFLSVDLDDTVVPELIPALFPCLLTIVSSPQVYDKYLRTKSYSIVYSCIAVLGVMSGVYKNGEEAGCQFRGRNLNAHQLQLLHVKSCKSLSIFLMDFVVMEVLKLF